MAVAILPDSFLTLLAAFQGCFTAPTFGTFQVLVTGWLHCLGRHTVTGVVVAAGAVGTRHISVFHRFFSRAVWSFNALGHVVFILALRWIPADQPLHFLGDDTLARKHGKCISLASMHHDPLLSTARKPFCSFGHLWVVLALWVPLSVGPLQGIALPFQVGLYVGTKRGGQTNAAGRPSTGKRHRAAQAAAAKVEHRTKLELLRELVGTAAAWAGDRTCYLVVDSAYAGRTLLEQRPPNVHVISRLRLDAALWTPPPPRRPGQRGRTRRRGDRLPTPKELAARRRRWHRVRLPLSGRRVPLDVFRTTALWYVALRDQPVRIVLVQDPTGRRRLDAFFCTDLTLGATAVLTAYARRWTLEVTFHDAKQFLGFEDPQNQAERAVQRTAPFALLCYGLVYLWAAQETAAGRPCVGPARPWYPHKRHASFLDLLTVLRQTPGPPVILDPPVTSQRPKNSRPPAREATRAAA